MAGRRGGYYSSLQVRRVIHGQLSMGGEFRKVVPPPYGGGQSFQTGGGTKSNRGGDKINSVPPLMGGDKACPPPLGFEPKLGPIKILPHDPIKNCYF